MHRIQYHSDTDLTEPTNHNRIAEPRTTATSTPTEEEKPRLGLSMPQIIGGALAAMTAAALGSRLSVAGTVVGAALASVIAAVAGAVYTASIKHTGNKVKSVWSGRVESTPTVVEQIPVESAPIQTPAAGSAEGAGSDASTAPVTDLPLAQPARTGFPWKRVLVGALATFALAAATLTGLELLTGHALSGGSGTTVEQVRENRTAPSEDSDRPSENEPSGATGDSSTEPGAQDGDAEPEPSAEPSATTEPTTEPSTEPTVEATERSEPSEVPSTPAPGEGQATVEGGSSAGSE